MKHIFSIICIGVILTGIIPISHAFAQGSESYCQEFSGFELYECRKQNLCDQYLPDYPVYPSTLFEEVVPKQAGVLSDNPFNIAQQTYRENMGNIYKCGILKTQKKTLTNIKQTFTFEQSGQLDGIIGSQVDMRVQKIDARANNLKCNFSSENRINTKLEILGETTQQMCQYTSYLEYLKEYYSDTGNAIHELFDSTNRENFGISEIPEKINTIQGDIQKEISHTYQVFPMAYHAYSQYENNYPIHFLLEIIRADFLILRKAMYETLMPIAQLGIKVINAMSY